MLKLIGSIFIVTAAAGIAGSFRRELADHLAVLYELKRLFVDLSCAGNGTLQPVEVLLGCFVRTQDVRLNEICAEIAGHLMEKREGQGEEVWRKVFADGRKELGLSAEEGELIENAGSAFFGKSLEENKRRLSLTLEQLDFMIETARREQKEKQRVYGTVSILSGLMLVILLI